MQFVIFLGPPGSGKGTQAQQVIKINPDIVHISTGQILRDEISGKTEFGSYLKELVDSGSYVPDEIMFKILEKKISNISRNSTLLFDGFPRTVLQADLMTHYIKNTRSKLKKVIYFHIDDEILIKRLSGRYACVKCGAIYHHELKKPLVENQCDICEGEQFEYRHDDHIDVITKRLQIYHQQTQPLVDFYELNGVLEKINADRPVRDIYSEIAKIVDL